MAIMVVAVVIALLLLAGIAASGLYAWQAIDEWASEVRALSSYPLRKRRCYRCRTRRPLRSDGSCSLCRASQRRQDIAVADVGQGYALRDNLPYGRYLEYGLALLDGAQVTLVVPVGLQVLAGDALGLLLDRKGRLRAVESPRLGSGWVIPVRGVGARSTVRYIGWMLMIPAACLLVVLLPVFALIVDADHTMHLLARLGGVTANQTAVIPTGAIVSFIVWVGLCLAVGGAITLLRRRPTLNADLGRGDAGSRRRWVGP
jgi:hypothetical protein